MRWLLGLVMLIALAYPVMGLSINVTSGKGVVGKVSGFGIRIYEENMTNVIPADVVLVIDCSGSMNRWGNIIAGPKMVELGCMYRKVGEFTLNKTSDVEVMLQIPDDVYTSMDAFEAYIVNVETGWVSSVKSNVSVVRWHSVPPGRYYVYARCKCCCCYPYRIFCVELPPTRLYLAKKAAEDFINILSPLDRIAVIEFSSHGEDYVDYTKVLQHLTGERESVMETLEGLRAMGGTPMGYGLDLAVKELDDRGRCNATKVIILLTDGWWNEGPNPIDVARVAAERGYRIYTIGYGGADEETLKEIASMTGGRYYYAANDTDLHRIYSEIAKEITVYARNVELRLKIVNSTFVNASSGYVREGDWLVWRFGDLNHDVNVTVNVTSSKMGRYEVAYGWLNYTLNGTRYHKGVRVYMEFVNHPPLVNVSGKTEIYEKHWLRLYITAVDPDGHEVYLTYNAPISGEFYRINESTWILKWMPSQDFVSEGSRTFTIVFNATDQYGASTVKRVNVTVYDLKKWLIVSLSRYRSTVYEGNCTTITIFVDSSSNYTISYSVDAKKGTYISVLERIGFGKSLFGFTPQYDLTDNVTNVTVTFDVKNSDGLEVVKSAVITVKNVNVTVWPKILTWDLGRRVYYVGEPLKVRVEFINATEGNLTVNGVCVWRGHVSQLDIRTLTFIPNTAGRYEVTVWAVRDGHRTSVDFPPVMISIKPVGG